MDKFDVSKIKVGDICITTNNLFKIGYITSVVISGNNNKWVDITGECCDCQNSPFEFHGTSETLDYGFKQIGTYKFDDEFYSTEIIRKLEPYRGSDLSQDKVNAIIVKKLNEVIDKLNEME